MITDICHRSPAPCRHGVGFLCIPAYYYWMIPPKPFVEHKDLLDGLASTNLRIKNRELGLLSLRKIGYHRLAGYRYLFREFLPIEDQQRHLYTFRSKKHLWGASLEQMVELASFDCALRQSTLEATEDFEIRLRTTVAHILASYDPYAYTDTRCLDNTATDKIPKGTAKRTSDEIFMTEVANVLDRAKRE
ncbi:Abi family protein [Corynebacterium diphtheriae]|uniref:Abi family protein n=3 Tax=Corynebacterium diphtheriae TaxID=1717 RepID=UPI0008935C01|nr:hypothetical protein BKD82_02220 [Corynebacterium diphtheriae]OFI63264.1 hypothetical protein BKD87_02215 [Corynebacterium diphtheriae]OSQ19300.1 hypothetical protein B1A54_04610 [Corynebacterium diphtheriae]